VRPALVGAALDGRHGRGRVSDTDAGRLDADPRWDAPVGPMALLPSTWTSVAVDADDDGRRDPQDLDDASLAAAVLLCSTMQHGTPLRAALRAYHRAPHFVRTVLILARRYARQATDLPPYAAGPQVALPTLPPLACTCDVARAHSALLQPSALPSTPTSPAAPATPSGSTTGATTGPPTDVPTDPSTTPTTPTPTSATTPATDPPTGSIAPTVPEATP
jgi:hypothetical protein